MYHDAIRSHALNTLEQLKKHIEMVNMEASITMAVEHTDFNKLETFFDNLSSADANIAECINIIKGE
jgi:hypothetical protein